MIHQEAIEEVEQSIRQFSEGTPMHKEIEVADGVWFDFDCPFVEDLDEPIIPVSVAILPESPHNIGKPNCHRLMDYSEFADELSCALDEAFYRADSWNEEVVFEYSAKNGDPINGFYLFLGSIDNPRNEVMMDGVVVKGGYA